MLHDVYLYGELAEKYGKVNRFDIKSAPEAVRAFEANFKGFCNDFKDGLYEVVVGTIEDGVRLGYDTLQFCLGQTKELHFIPRVEGAKSNGVAGAIQAVVGIALIVVGVLLIPVSGGLSSALIGLGVSMTLSGIATMITPVPKTNNSSVSPFGTDQTEAADERSSFIFNGPVNKSTEGAVIPVVYGQMRVGSIVASAGISVGQL